MSKFDPEVVTDDLLRAAFESIIKDYSGQDDLFRYPGMDGPICAVPSIPTGSISLDAATGVGGIPMGRLTIIAGEPSTGKSTLCLETIKNQQKMDSSKTNIYMDLETGAFTDLYAKNLGLDLDPNSFIIITPTHLQQGMEACYRLISTGKVGVCVWDSIAGASSKESVGKSMEEAESMAMKARLLSDHLGKIATKCGKTGTALILVNQTRTQMGTGFSWTDISGGRAQKFFSSLRVDLEKKETVKDFSGKITSETIVAKVKKNKVGAPYRMAEFDIRFGFGIMREADILKMAGQEGLIDAKGGGHFVFFDLETGEVKEQVRGKQFAIEYLLDNPSYTDELETRILGLIRTTNYCQEELDQADAITNGHIDVDEPEPMILEDNMIALGL